MQEGNFRFEWKIFGKDRGVGFLSCSNLHKIDGKRKFDLLETDNRQALLARFESWVGGLILDSWYHGFNKTQHGGKYTQCFQFRLSDHRFYGFLCHPESDARFQICALAINVIKRQWNVEEKYLKLVADLSRNSNAIKAVNASFVSEKDGQQ